MFHYFDTDVAKEYGVDQAIMIANFQFWISHNASNKKNYYEGYYWTYNSYKALAILFPYYSEKQIRRVVGSLVTSGILRTGNYNTKEYDLTKWYAFNDEEKWLSNIPSAQMGKGGAQTGRGGAEMGNSSAQMGKPLPDSTLHILNTDTFTSPNGDVSDQKNQSDSEAKGKRKKVAAKKEKIEPPPREHWAILIDLWFQCYEFHKKEKPTFLKEQPKLFGELVDLLKGKVIEKGNIWDEATAKNTLLIFLNQAYKNEWLSQNFLLSNLVKQFDKIIADAKSGGVKSGVVKGQQQVSGISAFSKFSELNNDAGG